jgi:hypothetical protein
LSWICQLINSGPAGGIGPEARFAGSDTGARLARRERRGPHSVADHGKYKISTNFALFAGSAEAVGGSRIWSNVRCD